MKRKFTPLLSALVALSIFVGISIDRYNQKTPKTNETSALTLIAEKSTLIAEKSAAENTMTIFRIASDTQGRHLVPETITLSDDLTSDESRLSAAIRMMTQGKNAPLPKGTMLRSLKIKGDTATIDLSHEYKDNFKVGDELESLVVQAITGTLGEFKGVKQVQFLIERKKIDSLGGNIAFDIPVPTPQELIKELAKESESRPASR
jgi:germination protein M